MDWMDFNKDGEVDITEEYLGIEILCGSREEHEALFGDAGDFPADEEDVLDDELEMAELVNRLGYMQYASNINL